MTPAFCHLQPWAVADVTPGYAPGAAISEPPQLQLLPQLLNCCGHCRAKLHRFQKSKAAHGFWTE